jgi:hypothetical protein
MPEGRGGTSVAAPVGTQLSAVRCLAEGELRIPAPRGERKLTVPRDSIRDVAVVRSEEIRRLGYDPEYLTPDEQVELLELDERLGADRERCANPIRRIWAPARDGHGDELLSLADLAFDHCDAAAIERTPLLDVREVDDDYLFTGRKLAYAGGDGQLIVDNPYVGATLWLDSSEVERPVRTAGDLGPTL